MEYGTEPRARRERDHHWDAIRALLMLLGIPFHVALSYRPDREWIVTTRVGSDAFIWIGDLIHIFRMPAFFVVAGYFAALLLERRTPGAWLRGRAARLGIPLIASLLLLVPILNIACELSVMPMAHAMASFIDNSTSSGGYWVRHLWFLIVLLYCCVAAAGAVRIWPRLATAQIPDRIDRAAAARLPATLAVAALLIGLWDGVIVEAYHAAGLATHVRQEILRLEEAISFAPWFAAGWLLARAPRTLDRFGRLSWPVLIATLAATAATLAIIEAVHPALERFASAVAAVGVTQLLVTAARRWFERPSAIVRRLVDASFVIYLVHVPIVAIVVALGQHVAAPVAIKAVGAMMLTFALSYAAAAAIRRSEWLSFLFDGKPVEARRRAAAA